MSDIKLKRLP